MKLHGCMAALLMALFVSGIAHSSEGDKDASKSADAADRICPRLIGAGVPDVTLTSSTGEKVNLAALVRRKPAIIVFYRGGW